MSPYRKKIHSGWMMRRHSEIEQPNVKSVKWGGVQYQDVGPLVLECNQMGLSDDDWLKITQWMKHVVPHPGRRLQLLFSFGLSDHSQPKPLQLRLSSECAPISREQRQRVCGTFRAHQSADRPAQLEVLLRQNMHPA